MTYLLVLILVGGAGGTSIEKIRIKNQEDCTKAGEVFLKNLPYYATQGEAILALKVRASYLCVKEAK